MMGETLEAVLTAAVSCWLVGTVLSVGIPALLIGGLFVREWRS